MQITAIKQYLKLTAITVMMMLVLNACDKEVAEEENDNEVVTTLELHLIERTSLEHLIYKFDDPDGFGAGSVAPTVDLIKLSPNKVYDVELKLLNKTANPNEDVTGEVEEEAADHRFYFLPTTGANIAVSNFSNDANGVPIGITSTWTTGAKATGKIRIVLRHYPNGAKATDDPVDSPKSNTDVDTEFVTSVE
jgi:hypothetical protein